MSFASSPRKDEPDPRTSLRHVLAAETPQDTDTGKMDTDTPSTQPSKQQEAASQSAPEKVDEGGEGTPMYTSTTTTIRRNANGSVSSVYSGNKIRHLKKEDGVPLWRKDIQYEFLRAVFEDQTKVFTKVSDGSKGNTFADIYIDAMAKSSKCSKILKDKLLTDRPAAVNMAMVCLLVNVGRMNTTLNFFPEMRAQLRTYHSIPSLQAHQDPNAYKQLQDAPRLKSILKGATEDVEQPSTIEDIKAHTVPRTNPVNLIFVLAQYAPKISEIHFHPPRDFFDLVMRSALSSKSRATAFLWLMWWYLESDFSQDAALANPFGPGQAGTPGDLTGGLPIKIPAFEYLTEEQQAFENVDTEDEITFGEQKRKERIAILATDMPSPLTTGIKGRGPAAARRPTHAPTPLGGHDAGTASPARDGLSPMPRARGKGAAKVPPHDAGYPSDSDRTRSASPPPRSRPAAARAISGMHINTLLNDETPGSSPAGPSSRTAASVTVKRHLQTPANNTATSKRPRLDASTAHDVFDPSSPIVANEGPRHIFTGLPAGPHGYYLPLNGTDPSHKRTRPMTQHQQQVEAYRRYQVNQLLDKQLRHEYALKRKKRLRDGLFLRAWQRLKVVGDDWDTDDEACGGGTMMAGLGRIPGEEESWGETEASVERGLRRALKRLDRELAASLKDPKEAQPENDTAEGRRPVIPKERPRQIRRTKQHAPLQEQERDKDGDGDESMKLEEDINADDEELDDEDREMLGGVDVDDDTEDDLPAGGNEDPDDLMHTYDQNHQQELMMDD